MHDSRTCPRCGSPLPEPRNPLPTVDVLLFSPDRGVLLVERANPPLGWALPGGFVERGETCEAAAVREMREETGLDVMLTGVLGVYSDPARDPRHHTMSVVYTALCAGAGDPTAGDDAKGAAYHPLERLPELAFDHARIIDDFARSLARLSPGADGR